MPESTEKGPNTPQEPPLEDPKKPPSSLDSLQVEVHDKVVQDVLDQVAPGLKISPEHRKTFGELIKGEIEDGKRMDEQPKAAHAAIEILISLGYTEMKDINRKSLKPETDMDHASADLDAITRTANQPTENYPSFVGIYGLTANFLPDRTEYTQSFVDNIVNAVNDILQRCGDNGGTIFENLFKKSLRTKSKIDEIATHVNELGLQDDFEYKDGKMVDKHPEDIRQGALLDDVLRNKKDHPFLEKFDSIEAIKSTAETLNKVHASGHGVGEVLTNSVVLKVKDGKMAGSRLTLPTTHYTKETPKNEQQATDLLDLCFSMASAGFQTHDEAMAKTYLQTFLDTYSNAEVKAEMKKLLENGRPHLSQHNKNRLGFNRVANKDESFQKTHEILKSLL